MGIPFVRDHGNPAALHWQFTDAGHHARLPPIAQDENKRLSDADSASVAGGYRSDMQHPALRYFVTIAQSGSFREAAETLRVAQSALSRQVLRLEEELGTTLLERHARGVTLTQAGEIFLRYARDGLRQSEQLRAELDALRGLRRGAVRIAAIETTIGEFLPPIIHQFSERYPGIRLEVHVESTDRVLDAVRDLRVDLGLAFSPQVGEGIAVLHRQKAPLFAIVHPDHELSGRSKVTMAEAFAYPLALTTSSSGSRLFINQASKAAGLYPLPAFESNSTQLLLRFVQESNAVTFLPRLAAADLLRQGSVTAIRIRERLMNTSTIDVLAPASRAPSAASEEFLRLIRAAQQVSEA